MQAVYIPFHSRSIWFIPLHPLPSYSITSPSSPSIHFQFLFHSVPFSIQFVSIPIHLSVSIPFSFFPFPFQFHGADLVFCLPPIDHFIIKTITQSDPWKFQYNSCQSRSTISIALQRACVNSFRSTMTCHERQYGRMAQSSTNLRQTARRLMTLAWLNLAIMWASFRNSVTRIGEWSSASPATVTKQHS